MLGRLVQHNREPCLKKSKLSSKAAMLTGPLLSPCDTASTRAIRAKIAVGARCLAVAKLLQLAFRCVGRVLDSRSIQHAA